MEFKRHIITALDARGEYSLGKGKRRRLLDGCIRLKYKDETVFNSYVCVLTDLHVFYVAEKPDNSVRIQGLLLPRARMLPDHTHAT